MRVYLKPPWMQRHVANRLVPLFQRSMISRLTVKGRRSGRERTVPVAVLDHEGERYLVSYRGLSDWALNLRTTSEGRLSNRGRAEDITVEEVPEADRPPLLAAYRERYSGMPTVTGVLDALPDPADHPVFRIRA
ncbi:nitroreductase family deazaflavin-dependent oxidoreductase [Streptomyces sp. NPDC102270]|uniref:nitroreductase family deazaflavin-dependent oxidoreductase n=1 Tax=Streptomyces sp. NPDC102270 TaxID=3366150 RepID=UPI00382C854B